MQDTHNPAGEKQFSADLIQQNVLSRLILSGQAGRKDIVSDICKRFKIDLFVNPQFRVFYHAIHALHNAGIDINPENIVTKMNGHMPKNVIMSMLDSLCFHPEELGPNIDLDLSMSQLMKYAIDLKVMNGIEEAVTGKKDTETMVSHLKNILEQVEDLKKSELLVPDLNSLRVANWAIPNPPPQEYTISFLNRGFFPKSDENIVGAVVGDGGTGKSSFCLQLFYHLSAGVDFGPLKITEPRTVLYLGWEDSQMEMNRRLDRITGGTGNYPHNFYAKSLFGEVGALFEMEGANVVRSKWFTWLEEVLKQFTDLDTLIIDPLASACGLEENNVSANAWISGMRYLAKKYKINVLYIHHISKEASKSKKLSQHDSRGATGFVAGVRWQLGMRTLHDDNAKRFSIPEDEQHNYIEVKITKSNCTPLSPTIFFERQENGTTFSMCNPAGEANLQIAELLVGIMSGMNQKGLYLTRNELVKGKTNEAKEIGAEIKKAFPRFSKRMDMGGIIDFCLKEGWILERDYSSGAYTKQVLVVNNGRPEF